MPEQKIVLEDDYLLGHVMRALAEDFGEAGDVTSKALVDPHQSGKGKIIARQDGVICGLRCAELTFKALNENAVFSSIVRDGATVLKGHAIADIETDARSLLGGERTALNFLGRLSGIATLTKQFSDAIAHTQARICDTRKTTPGLRLLEKYAVSCGGGANHRLGLYDAVLIKDNHLALAGSVEFALKRVQASVGPDIEIEVEVDTIEQLQAALKAGARRILLDNMTLDELRACVKEARTRAILEASGNVTLETVRDIAETGVDLVSSGALTHSARVMDLSLEISF